MVCKISVYELTATSQKVLQFFQCYQCVVIGLSSVDFENHFILVSNENYELQNVFGVDGCSS